MAASSRKTIMDRVLALMATITTANSYLTNVGSVSETLSQYDQIPEKDLPAVMPIDADEIRSWESFDGSRDRRGELDIIISCVVFEGTGSTRTARLNLMQDIEKAMLNDATLAALIIEIDSTDIITDKGTLTKYSVWDQRFSITYFYDSGNGG